MADQRLAAGSCLEMQLGNISDLKEGCFLLWIALEAEEEGNG